MPSTPSVEEQVKPAVNLENNMQNPKTPDQGFLNTSNDNQVGNATTPSVEDLLNSTPKRDN